MSCCEARNRRAGCDHPRDRRPHRPDISGPGHRADLSGLTPTIVGVPGGSVTGTDGDDVIVTNGAVDTRADAGDDTVCVTSTPGTTTTATVDAGPGDDYLRGKVFPERLIGGPGTDKAWGQGGRDVCRAEQKLGCEA